MTSNAYSRGAVPLRSVPDQIVNRNRIIGLYLRTQADLTTFRIPVLGIEFSFLLEGGTSLRLLCLLEALLARLWL